MRGDLEGGGLEAEDLVGGAVEEAAAAAALG